MSYFEYTPVTDIRPWPNGKGFQGADEWWHHIRLQEEKQRLDSLLGVALLDDSVCDRLLHQRDPELMTLFGLSQQTQKWLREIQADSLLVFAEAISRDLANGIYSLDSAAA